MHGVEIGGGGGSMLGMNGGGFVVEELSPCSCRCLACCLLRLVLLLSSLRFSRSQDQKEVRPQGFALA